MRREW